MQHGPLLTLCHAIFLFAHRSCFGYDEAPWQPIYDYYHIDLGYSGGHHVGPHIKAPEPKDVMVDVINDLGVKLLAIHNEHNENNIGISPYGALSMLAALTEGVQGDAAKEIIYAAHIPKDKQVVRIGLRDIHRHLKSYFIPQEGFLAGLTLNLNNVTLRSDYADILRFYGFDYESFNNALYPGPSTTPVPTEGNATLGTTLGMPEMTTKESQTTSKPVSTENKLGFPMDTTVVTEKFTTSTLETTPEVRTTPATTLSTTYSSMPMETTRQHTDTTTDALSTLPLSTTTQNVQHPTTVTVTEKMTTTTFKNTEMPTTKAPETTTVYLTTTTYQPTSVPTTIQLLRTTTTVPPISTITTVQPIPTTATVEHITTTTTIQPIPTTITDQPTTITTIVWPIPTTTTVQPLPIPTTIQPITTTTTDQPLPTTTTIQPITTTTTVPPIPTTTTVQPVTTTSTVQPIPTTTTVQPITTTTTVGPIPTTTAVQPIPTTTTVGPIPTTTTVQPITTTTTVQPIPTTTTVQPITTTTTVGPIPTTTTVGPIPTTTTVQPITTTTTVQPIPTTTTVQPIPTTTTVQPPSSIATTIPIPTTTTAEPSQTTTTIQPKTKAMGTTGPTHDITTQFSEMTTKNEVATTLAPTTLSTTTNIITTTIPITTLLTTKNVLTTTTLQTLVPETTSTMLTTEKENTDVSRTTEEITTETKTKDQITTVPSPTVIMPSTESSQSITSEMIPITFLETTTRSTMFTQESISTTNVPENVPETTPPEVFQQLQDFETTTPFFFGATPQFQDMNAFGQNNFDFNYNYDSNSQFNNGTSTQGGSLYDDSSYPLNLDHQTNTDFNANERKSRSVTDYILQRFHGHHINHYNKRPFRPYYIPQEPLTFMVYGKRRESGINFMKYDTVLPFFFAANLNTLALSFPLDNSKYYLLLLLPIDYNGVDQLICDLRLHGNFKFILENLRLTHVIATIPSFTLKGYVTLTPSLQQLGVRRIFEPREADFSPMTNATDIYVTNIEQAVTVTIQNYLDPATAQNYKNFRRHPPVYFKADHPFLYFVMDTELNVALMVGKLVNPLNSRIR